LFVIADGMITGSGNDKSTPEILLDMMEIDVECTGEDPEGSSYLAIAAGSHQHNMAKVVKLTLNSFPSKHYLITILL
jgi:chitin synthase